jgi:hypothetical protein
MALAGILAILNGDLPGSLTIIGLHESERRKAANFHGTI